LIATCHPQEAVVLYQNVEECYKRRAREMLSTNRTYCHSCEEWIEDPSSLSTTASEQHATYVRRLHAPYAATRHTKSFCGVAHCYLCQDRWRSECEDHKWDLRQKQTTEDDLFDEAGENVKKRAETQATVHFEVHGKSTGFEQNWRTAF
jgi:hypothetical protein